jgi:NAD-dependent deacetylase
VYPAAGLVNYVPRTARIYVIDPQTVKISNSPRIRYLETTATQGMKTVVGELM